STPSPAMPRLPPISPLFPYTTLFRSRRSQTSKSFSSGMTFQLIALTGSVWLSTYSSYSFGTVSTYLLDLESDVISGSQHTPKHDPLSAGVPHFSCTYVS